MISALADLGYHIINGDNFEGNPGSYRSVLQSYRDNYIYYTIQ